MLFRAALWCSAAFLSASARNATSKRGIAFSAPDTPGDLKNANQTKSQITWQYDWGNSPPNYMAVDNIDYIPMQWGSEKIELFTDAVKTQGAKTILAFNEPDFDQESNMLPEEAAKLWKQYLEPMKADGIRLGAPAVTGSPTGQPWLAQFFQLCTNCSVDFIPLHWYGEGEEGFYNYLWEVHNKYPKLPIWVTEYASTSTNDTEVARFLNATITYLDTLDWVERYAWFGYFRPRPDAHYNLLGDDGSLNVLGQMYVGAKTVHTEVVSRPATKTYQTVNGADNPTQALVTTYAAAPNAAIRGQNIFGSETGSHSICLSLAILASVVGTVWTVW